MPTLPVNGGASASRGARRRAQLLGAGRELLAEQGWSGVTARAVAERAGTHPALLHHHFGGLPAFRREVAAAAVHEAFEPAIAVMTAAESWTAGLAAVLRHADQHGDPTAARTSAELIAAAVQDPEIGGLVARSLADARARLVPWLAATGAEHPEGLATLLVAVLDGLLLHRLLDQDLHLEHVVEAAGTLGAATGEAPGS